MNSSPGKKKMWCIPEGQSADFACKMEDVLDVYKLPYDEQYPVVCMDELCKQLTTEKRVSIPAKPGTIEKYDSEYERNGVGNVFLAVEPKKGIRITQVTQRRTKQDFARFLKELVDSYTSATKIRLVMDNLNTHNGSSLYETFPPEEAKRILDKVEIHYTPKHGSWLNIVEIEFSHLSRQVLDQRVADLDTLSNSVAIWTHARNQEKSVVDWQFTTPDARIKLKKLYPQITAPIQQ